MKTIIFSRLFSTEKTEPKEILEGHSGAINALANLPSGEFVSASDDCTLKIWNSTTNQVVRTLSGHLGPVLSVAVFSDGRIASGSLDGYMIHQLWLNKEQTWILSSFETQVFQTYTRVNHCYYIYILFGNNLPI